MKKVQNQEVNNLLQNTFGNYNIKSKFELYYDDKYYILGYEEYLHNWQEPRIVEMFKTKYLIAIKAYIHGINECKRGRYGDLNNMFRFR